jgi:hypothetical protein
MLPPSLSESQCQGVWSTIDRWFDKAVHDQACESKAKIANFDAPLSQWHQFKPFETLPECQAEKERLSAKKDDYSSFGVNARCIATDDPRLKEN